MDLTEYLQTEMNTLNIKLLFASNFYVLINFVHLIILLTTHLARYNLLQLAAKPLHGAGRLWDVNPCQQLL